MPVQQIQVPVGSPAQRYATLQSQKANRNLQLARQQQQANQQAEVQRIANRTPQEKAVAELQSIQAPEGQIRDQYGGTVVTYNEDVLGLAGALGINAKVAYLLNQSGALKISGGNIYFKGVPISSSAQAEAEANRIVSARGQTGTTDTYVGMPTGYRYKVVNNEISGVEKIPFGEGVNISTGLPSQLSGGTIERYNIQTPTSTIKYAITSEGTYKPYTELTSSEKLGGIRIREVPIDPQTGTPIFDLSTYYKVHGISTTEVNKYSATEAVAGAGVSDILGLSLEAPMYKTPVTLAEKYQAGWKGLSTEYIPTYETIAKYNPESYFSISPIPKDIRNAFTEGIYEDIRQNPLKNIATLGIGLGFGAVFNTFNLGAKSFGYAYSGIKGATTAGKVAGAVGLGVGIGGGGYYIYQEAPQFHQAYKEGGAVGVAGLSGIALKDLALFGYGSKLGSGLVKGIYGEQLAVIKPTSKAYYSETQEALSPSITKAKFTIKQYISPTILQRSTRFGGTNFYELTGAKMRQTEALVYLKGDYAYGMTIKNKRAMKVELQIDKAVKSGTPILDTNFKVKFGKYGAKRVGILAGVSEGLNLKARSPSQISMIDKPFAQIFKRNLDVSLTYPNEPKIKLTSKLGKDTMGQYTPSKNLIELSSLKRYKTDLRSTYEHERLHAAGEYAGRKDMSLGFTKKEVKSFYKELKRTEVYKKLKDMGYSKEQIPEEAVVRLGDFVLGPKPDYIGNLKYIGMVKEANPTKAIKFRYTFKALEGLIKTKQYTPIADEAINAVLTGKTYFTLKGAVKGAKLQTINELQTTRLLREIGVISDKAVLGRGLIQTKDIYSYRRAGRKVYISTKPPAIAKGKQKFNVLTQSIEINDNTLYGEVYGTTPRGKYIYKIKGLTKIKPSTTTDDYGVDFYTGNKRASPAPTIVSTASPEVIKTKTIPKLTTAQEINLAQAKISLLTKPSITKTATKQYSALGQSNQLRTIYATGTKQEGVTKQVPRLIERSITKQSSSTKQVPRLIERSITKQSSSTKQVPRLVERVVTKSIERVIQKPIERVIEKPIERVVTKPITPTIVTPRIPKPKEPIGYMPPKFKFSTPKITKGRYAVEVRRFGKFKNIGVFGSLQQAFAAGTNKARGTLARTFKVTGKSNMFRIPLGFYSKVSKKEGRVFIQKAIKGKLGTLGSYGEKVEIFKSRRKTKRLL